MPLGKKKTDFDYVVERLGITAKDIVDTAEKYGIEDDDKAYQLTVLEKAMTPPLKRPDIVENPRYDSTGPMLELMSGAAGGALAGSPGGPGGMLTGAAVGALLPTLRTAITKEPGKANSWERVADVVAPGIGKGMAATKLGPIAKRAVDSLLQAGMGAATEKMDEKFQGPGSPVMRGVTQGALGMIGAPVGRQAQRMGANMDLVDSLQNMDSYSKRGPDGKFRKINPEALQETIKKNIHDSVYPPPTPKPAKQVIPPTPQELEAYEQAKWLNSERKKSGIPSLPLEKPKGKVIETPVETPKLPYSKETLAAPGVAKIVKNRPEQLYKYILDPITEAQDIEGVRKGIPQFSERLKAVDLLAGTKGADDVARGLRTQFFNSLAKSKDGAKLANPDSFRVRLNAIGPEVTNRIFGDPQSYEKLTSLSEAASKAGSIGRYIIKMGEDGITIFKKAPMDRDSTLGPLGIAASKGIPAAMAGLMGGGIGGGSAVAAGAAGYEGFKFGINKLLLDKRSKKTLDILTKGLQNSSIDAVDQKLSEWLSEEADEKFKF